MKSKAQLLKAPRAVATQQENKKTSQVNHGLVVVCLEDVCTLNVSSHWTFEIELISISILQMRTLRHRTLTSRVTQRVNSGARI